MRKTEINITKRAQEIAPFYVMELLEKAKAMEAKGEHIVHMEVGEPDFPTPQPVKEAAIKAIQDNHTFYTHSLGLPELRSRVAEYYWDETRLRISPERIVITNGTSGAFLLLCAALIDKKRGLALSDPGYPCYRNFGLLTDADITPIFVSEDTRFEVTVDHLKSLKKTPHMLILSNPSNPTGMVFRQKTISELYTFFSERGGFLVVDEIYAGLTYGKRLHTSLSIADEIIVVNGFSKTHAMTGWRLGWMVVPRVLVRPIQKIAQNIFISPPSVSQYAAMRAFDVKNDLEHMRKTYKKRRDFMLPRLKQLGFRIPLNPDGAFYIYAGIEKWGIDSMEFVARALSEGKIALTPGYDFGSFKASSHIRFSYANSLEMLTEGCGRLERWLKTL